jgi:hypothetical protein
MSGLRHVYTWIDNASNLLWRSGFETQLCHRRGGANTRSSIADAKKGEDSKWEKETDAGFGYGEIT